MKSLKGVRVDGEGKRGEGWDCPTVRGQENGEEPSKETNKDG